VSANGRRAWREAAKRCRRWLHKHFKRNEPWPLADSKTTYRDACPPEMYRRTLSEMRAGHMRRHGLRAFENGERFYSTFDGHTTIIKDSPAPWSARSLVGMSMGARKRAALAEVADRAILVNPPTSYLYRLHRQRYRIGERLRPCPGCRLSSRLRIAGCTTCQDTGVIAKGPAHV